MGISCATNGIQTGSEENPNIEPKKKRNIQHPQLRWKDQHALQEGRTDHAWPNP
jgi:hypothetical protein